ncbi:SDR family oxidoreductase [Piscinibacter sp. XHJ-5]|uniref:SDR family oxidoreductase n=1 Tax=Piscinibacter sp. XHJ-5 TaxID=3037797 RepID=UPI002452913D|nr:SDR family oxidoreductase [Piscinibacter sp. XHJ-5]
MAALELWAGPECTVNRVRDVVRDQLEETGFAQRLDDLDRLASLGIRTLRFPLLWERTAADGLQHHDWRWADARLARMRELGMSCIAGLLHHGSGPMSTHLLDPAFASHLAHYAGCVARRYPQLDAYTPVNEPLTTARFGGLYGVWHPHRADDRSFVRAVLNQVQATVSAMRAIRAVQPAARLVQTDDLGYTRAVPRLQYQADFENERRWLAFDLLEGRVDRRHRLWRYLRRHGASEAELVALVDAPCPPDVIGINCYVTSERFLDNRLRHYPARLHGGNRRHRYVDVETVRVHGSQTGGFDARLLEAWQRYRRPLALTEVHLGCTREEQMRWLHQAWQAAHRVRAEGADIRAVTAWAAFGTVDWDSLVTQRSGRYEAGLWDVRGGAPRRTALAQLATQLAQGKEPDHPVLAGSGWWQRRIRHLYPTHGAPLSIAMDGRPLLITGGRGTLGRAYAHLCHMRGLPYVLLGRADLDIAEPRSIEAALRRWKPWAVINAAGFVRVDDAERQQPTQWRENVLGPALLAQACAGHALRLVTYSSDLVFDGAKAGPYVERDEPCPLNAYGEAKAEAERRVLAHAPDALVVRTAAFFGPWDRHNFVTQGLHALRGGARWPAAVDQEVSPTYVRDLVMASLDLLLDGESGIWHLANRGAASWFELATMAARAAGLGTEGIDAVRGETLGQVARRPRQAVLASERGQVMPPLDDALRRYVIDVGEDVLPQEDGGEQDAGMRRVA